MEKYKKPPLTFAQQVDLLKNRGLIVNDVEKAEKFLSQVNYYRFSGYLPSFITSFTVSKGVRTITTSFTLGKNVLVVSVSLQAHEVCKLMS